MAYSPNPIHFNLDINGHGVVLERDGTLFSGPVDSFLISYWEYGFGNTGFFIVTDDPGGTSGNGLTFWPSHKSGSNLVIGATKAGSSILNVTYPSLPDAACPCHFLVSVRLSTSTIQVYVNDEVVSGTPTWTTPSAITFTGASTVASWGNPQAPYLNWVAGYGSDFWFGTTAGFVDLSVTANRRKFINADLTPVDLGGYGQNPFGTSPQVFQNVLAGGVANDWLTNHGSAAGTFAVDQGTITLDGNPCGTTPPPPPSSSLAMDNVVAIDTSPRNAAGSQIFLDWSDDRAHSFGNPVGQPIGATGRYLTAVQWQRLGMGRDRCFRLTWSVPVRTALQGAWVEIAGVAKS